MGYRERGKLSNKLLWKVLQISYIVFPFLFKIFQVIWKAEGHLWSTQSLTELEFYSLEQDVFVLSAPTWNSNNNRVRQRCSSSQKKRESYINYFLHNFQEVQDKGKYNLDNYPWM